MRVEAAADRHVTRHSPLRDSLRDCLHAGDLAGPGLAPHEVGTIGGLGLVHAAFQIQDFEPAELAGMGFRLDGYISFLERGTVGGDIGRRVGDGALEIDRTVVGQDGGCPSGWRRCNAG